MKLTQRRIPHAYILAWSSWRRAHQARARKAHLKKGNCNVRFERTALEKYANDACLPEALNERAARLLSQMDR